MKVLKTIGFWFWSLTWGALMSIPGLIASFVVIVFFKGKPHKNGLSFIVETGGNWGGLNLGVVSFCGRYSQEDGPCYDIDWYEHTRKHEFGHSLQNLIWGPLMLFVIAIPSFIRYWYQTIRARKGLPNREYDDIWFEGQATKWGNKVYNRKENN